MTTNSNRMGTKIKPLYLLVTTIAECFPFLYLQGARFNSFISVFVDAVQFPLVLECEMWKKQTRTSRKLYSSYRCVLSRYADVLILFSEAGSTRMYLWKEISESGRRQSLSENANPTIFNDFLSFSEIRHSDLSDVCTIFECSGYILIHFLFRKMKCGWRQTAESKPSRIDPMPK